MTAEQTFQPTQTELGLLKVLWRRGPSTIREVLETLDERDRPGYTTVLKLLQIMHRKGLVERDESQRSHVYSPTSAEEEIQDRLVDNLLQRAFDGSAARLVMRALSNEAATDTELAEIRKYLNRMEKERSLP
jgi:predicted transcriptional regulator